MHSPPFPTIFLYPSQGLILWISRKLDGQEPGWMIREGLMGHAGCLREVEYQGGGSSCLTPSSVTSSACGIYDIGLDRPSVRPAHQPPVRKTEPGWRNGPTGAAGNRARTEAKPGARQRAQQPWRATGVRPGQGRLLFTPVFCEEPARTGADWRSPHALEKDCKERSL